MIVLDEQRLTQFFEDLASGFGATAADVILSLLVVVVVFGAPTLVWIVGESGTRRRRIAKARALFQSTIARMKLSPSEQDLLLRLSRASEAPERMNLLLRKSSALNAAVNNLLPSERVAESSITALRLKLGLRSVREEAPLHSTAELPEGLRVRITDIRHRILRGTLTGHEPLSLLVELDPDQNPPPDGSSARVHFFRRTGIFWFSTWVQSHAGNLVKVAHCERITRIQKRSFYRRCLSVPVSITQGPAEECLLNSTLIDLSGGGASLSNIDDRFAVGDRLILGLQTAPEDANFVDAEVVRLSHKGRHMHVRFEGIPEGVRDKIIRFVLRPRRRPLRSRTSGTHQRASHPRG